MTPSLNEPDPRKGEGQDAPLTVYFELQRKVQDCAAELARTQWELQDEVLRRIQAQDELEVRTAQPRTAALELTQAEQHERQRMAGVLHGHLQQLLVAVQLKIVHMATSLDENERHTAIREATSILPGKGSRFTLHAPLGECVLNGVFSGTFPRAESRQ